MLLRAELQTCEAQLFSSESYTQQLGIQKLVHFSHDENPTIRRACIYIFSTIPDYPEISIDPHYIKERLSEIAEDEGESQIVRLDAKKALEKFEGISRNQ